VHDSGLCKFLGCCTCDSTVQVTKAKNKKKKPDTPLRPGHDKFPPKVDVEPATMPIKGGFFPGVLPGHPQVDHPGEKQKFDEHHSFMQVNASLAEQVEEAGMEMTLVDDDGKEIPDEHKDEHKKCHGGHFLFYCQNICCSPCKAFSADQLTPGGDGLEPPPHGDYPDAPHHKKWSLLEDSKEEDPHAHFNFHTTKKCPLWAEKGKLSKENCYENGCCAFDKGPCDLVPCFKRCVKSDKKH
jgi:hypothetical protein